MLDLTGRTLIILNQSDYLKIPIDTICLLFLDMVTQELEQHLGVVFNQLQN